MTSHNFLRLLCSCPRFPRTTQMGRLCAREPGNCVRAFRRGGWVAVVDRRWGGGDKPAVECALPLVDEVGGGVADGPLNVLNCPCGLERGELVVIGTDVIGAFAVSCTARSGPRRRPSPCSLEDCWLHLARTYELNTFAAGLPCYEVIRGGGTTNTGPCNVILPRLRVIAAPLRRPYTLSVTIGG